jgi:deoxyhypusine synthase
VSFGEWLESLPDILAVRDLKLAAQAIHRARREGKGVLLGMGAHPVKVGLGGLIAEALADRLFTGVATNGAAIIHDYELALTGKTSENVDVVLSEGTFGMAEETSAQLNKAISNGAGSGDGIGYTVGKLIAHQNLPHADVSVFAAAYRNQVPATVHVALGTDIIHMHPTCDGAATGKATMDDFRLFTRQVAALEGGVFINLGSAVIIPEVFLKACSLSLNLGHSLEGLTTVNMDFIQQYRSRVNVVERPTGRTGKGLSLTGHHELLLPLLLAAVRDLG